LGSALLDALPTLLQADYETLLFGAGWLVASAMI
jgi:hypothetical protein